MGDKVNWRDAKAMRERIAELEAAMAGAEELARRADLPAPVRVKPLVWEGPAWKKLAQTPWGRYAVSKAIGAWYWSWNGDMTPAQDEAAAKAAAQADYEARILAELEPKP